MRVRRRAWGDGRSGARARMYVHCFFTRHFCRLIHQSLIFQSEAPLLIKPYLSDLTNSELHAVLTGGFGTIAGSILAAYISFGISASHLLSACVMSAPAALLMSKIIYPETQDSRTSSRKE